MSAQRYRFENVEKLTAQEAELRQALHQHLGARVFARGFLSELGGTCGRYLKEPLSITPSPFVPLDRTKLQRVLPSQGCFLVIGAAPGNEKIVVDLDINLATIAIDRLLGGSGQSAALKRPLSDIEQGVLSFLILKALAHFHARWETAREWALTFDGVVHTVEAAASVLGDAERFMVAGCRMNLGSLPSYARVVLPYTLLQVSTGSGGAGGDALAQGGGTPLEYAAMRTRLSALGEYQVPARLEVATLDLGLDDLKTLELGDIIVLEQHKLQKTAAGIEGEVFVRVGLGQNGGLRAFVRQLDGGDIAKLEVLEVLVQEHPTQGEVMSEEGAAAGEDEVNLEANESLLRDVPAPVVVELGRLKLNTAQVVRIRPGQILKLARGPNDPVSLVVRDKVYARGELVLVDGELGVRIVQMVGN